MNSTVLRKARLWTLAAATVISLVLGRLTDARFALGFLGSAAWAVIGFWLVEALIRRALVPPAVGRNRGAIALLVAGKLALYALALWILLSGIAPAMSCLYGFSLILIVLVITVLAIRPGLSAERLSERGDHD
ncbi:hypothetical protein KKG45_10795 [bacterium]|nr:hypothetical protein [bacterium]MBU1073723.1 hypothetical protein [bacterium]